MLNLSEGGHLESGITILVSSQVVFHLLTSVFLCRKIKSLELLNDVMSMALNHLSLFCVVPLP